MPFTIAKSTATLATSPEDAAQVFKAAMTKALAEAAAKAITEALGSNVFATNPATAGWQDFVSGAHFEVFWDKPALAKSLMSQVTSFAPYQAAATANPSLFGGSVEIGISIKGTF